MPPIHARAFYYLVFDDGNWTIGQAAASDMGAGIWFNTDRGLLHRGAQGMHVVGEVPAPSSADLLRARQEKTSPGPLVA